MKKKILLFCLVGLLLLGASIYILLPRYLLHAATQKPKDAVEFVTAPVKEVNLSQRVNQSMQQQANSAIPQPASQPTAQPSSSLPDYELHLPAKRPAQGQSPPLSQQQPSAPAQGQSDAGQPISPTATQNTTQTSPLPSLQQTPPANHSKNFRVQVSENEVAGMIYNGIHERTMPEYQPSLKGVSVRFSDGVGKVTIALEPRYLPADMLRNFPGIDQNSPTIYVGGEIGMTFDSETVHPEIRNVSLGNIQIPFGLVKSMIKYEVHSRIRQLTRLESGQQAQLSNVAIGNGSLTIEGTIK